jgi:hypothetical protein
MQKPRSGASIASHPPILIKRGSHAGSSAGHTSAHNLGTHVAQMEERWAPRALALERHGEADQDGEIVSNDTES